MSDSLKSAFVRSFIFPVMAAAVIVAVFKTWRPEKFSRVSKTAAQEYALPVFGKVPDFSLIQSNGKKMTKADLEGKIWIADFIFTRCAGVCPLMSSKMRQLAKELETETDIRFVSFSVDPAYDTPEILAKYAARFEAPEGRWFFLTGDQEQIFRLSNQHFHLGASEVPPEEREAMDQTVRHSAKFVLVDGQGQIRGYYDSEEQNFGQKIVKDAALLRSGN